MNNKKDEDKIKEEMEKLIKEELAKQQKLVIFFKYGLHPNFSLHILFTILINLVLISSIQGLTNFALITDYVIYGLTILFFSFTEIFGKLLINKLMHTFNLYSLGLVDFIIVMLLFYLTIILPKGMRFNHLWQLIIFVSIFLILRAILSFYLKMIFHNPKKGDKQ